MKIRLVSDLHLEFSDINIKNNGNDDVLILSGDIMVAQDMYDHPAGDWEATGVPGLSARQTKARRFRDFLKRCSFQFPHVIYIAGNHEFYHGKWNQTLDILADECKKYPNVYFLDNATKKIDDVTFIGGTLWTNMNKHDPLTLHAVRDMLNDFRLIRKEFEGYTALKPADTCVRHYKMLEHVKTTIEANPTEKYVVVGHHSPSFLSVHDDYKADYIMNAAYHSDLSEFILDHPQIKLWTHGHTHHAFDYMIGLTRIVCNPRGYESDGYVEMSGWDPTLVLEV